MLEGLATWVIQPIVDINWLVKDKVLDGAKSNFLTTSNGEVVRASPLDRLIALCAERPQRTGLLEGLDLN